MELVSSVSETVSIFLSTFDGGGTVSTTEGTKIIFVWMIAKEDIIEYENGIQLFC
jgi:hypothetical protein